MALWENLHQELVPAGPHLDAAGRRVAARFPVRLSRAWMERLGPPGSPLRRQALPDPRELEDPGQADPLDEERLGPVPFLVHKYPDRVLVLACRRCALYCRFCTRKRLVGRGPAHPGGAALRRIRDYITARPGVREVILSGGDPLLLDDATLESMLALFRAIPHVRLLRIHTRVPSTLPRRVTPELAGLLARFQPLYVNIHVNHAHELGREARQACALLADAGLPLGSQSVLLAGVNDSAGALEELFMELLCLRVRPYYLHHLDPAPGTAHFRVPLERGLELMETLRGRIPGMGMPAYALDLPGGRGKVRLNGGLVRSEGNLWIFRDFEGRESAVHDHAAPHPATGGERPAAPGPPWPGQGGRQNRGRPRRVPYGPPPPD